MTKNLTASKASKHKPRQFCVQNKLLFVYFIFNPSFYFFSYTRLFFDKSSTSIQLFCCLLFYGQKPQFQYANLEPRLLSKTTSTCIKWFALIFEVTSINHAVWIIHPSTPQLPDTPCFLFSIGFILLIHLGKNPQKTFAKGTCV